VEVSLSKVDDWVCVGGTDEESESGETKNEPDRGKLHLSLEGQEVDRKSLRAVTGKTTDWNEIAKDCIAFANATGGRWRQTLAALLGGVMSRLSDNKRLIDDSWAIVARRYAGTGLMNQSVLSTTGEKAWAIAMPHALSSRLRGGNS